MDGYVTDPPVIKELMRISDLKEAYELAQSAAHLGFGVRISNVMNTLPDRTAPSNEAHLQEMWTVEILDDVPLDPDELKGT
ncbi:hypothetical protein ACFYWD_33625 [Streptomyces sp. NPDC003781]|uniref:hypothetical protein n=1 Tax=Streptomyces sp. NPDC003781 TaxID=3364686 RepID=UPI00368B7449